MKLHQLLFVAFTFAACQSLTPSLRSTTLALPVSETLQKLESAADKDRDKKITVKDGDTTFEFPAKEGDPVKVKGHYPLSVALQELSLAKDSGQQTLELPTSRLMEPPEDRLDRVIRDVFWEGLTRRLDAKGLPLMIDPKAKSAGVTVYVPATDPAALEYYRKVAVQLKAKGQKIEVVQLPKKIDPLYVRRLDGRHGILSLDLERDAGGKVKGAKPFVVPGGRFNEMYGWDSYFIILGLLADGKVELARDMVDHFVYQIKHYGKILNANRTYYLTRSQPPFTTSAILAVRDRLPQDDRTKAWFRASMLAAKQEYDQVWMSPPHLHVGTGLSRYHGGELGPCPEVEPGHYDHVLKAWVGKKPFEKMKTTAEVVHALEEMYRKDGKVPESLAELDTFFINDRAIRESGHDTTFRFDDRTTDFLSVDLNSLLAKTEDDFLRAIEHGDLTEKEFGAKADWQKKIAARNRKMMLLMYDADSGLFFDFDMKKREKSKYISATTFYPLWAKLTTKEEAARLAKKAIAELGAPGGLASTAASSQKLLGFAEGKRQWEYPNGWAPHQIIAWRGLMDYGLTAEALDLIDRWNGMIVMNFRDYNGTVPEKFNVVTRSHAVFEEYGNVGTDFSYITREGFGWMNASFKVGRELKKEAALLKR